MSKRPSITVSILIAGVAALFVLCVVDWLSSAVPAVPEREDATKVSGVIRSITADTRSKDISFLVATGGKRYLHYINRGLERDIDTSKLKAAIGKDVDVWYYTGGLNIFGTRVQSGHICELVRDGKVIYTEFAE
ncbi:MAG TPA: hypothetical protein VIN07_02950 [Flavipsychrobacter sp.]